VARVFSHFVIRVIVGPALRGLLQLVGRQFLFWAEAQTGRALSKRGSMKMKKTLHAFEIVSLLLFAGYLVVPATPLPAQERGQPVPASGAKPLTRVRFALANPIINPGLSFVWIGSHFGWYQREGIDLEIIRTQGPADAT